MLDFRAEIAARLTRTLRAGLARRLPALHEQARRQLVTELERFGEGEIAAQLPARCPYALQEVLGDWWPERR